QWREQPPKARYDHTAGAALVHRRGRERTGQREHDAHRREHNGQPRPAEEVVDDNPDDGHGSEQVEVPVAHRETVATATGRCSRSRGRQLRPAGLPRTNEVSVLSVRLCDDHDPWPCAETAGHRPFGWYRAGMSWSDDQRTGEVTAGGLCRWSVESGVDRPCRDGRWVTTGNAETSGGGVRRDGGGVARRRHCRDNG